MEASSGVQDGVLALPAGGGSVRGLGERFQPDLLRGTGNYAVAIDVPAGPNGLRPSLSLRYSTGQGNGPFGVGWRLAGALAITRATDGGLPRYDESDTFLLGGGEALVPVGGGRYRPRADTQFWDIRREGQGWRIRTKDGRGFVLGAGAEARIEDGARVFGWLVEQETDQAGNQIDYRYLRDGGQLYLSEVAWSIYSLRLAYEPRPDAGQFGRAGFPIQTRLRCARIERHCARLAQPLCVTYQLRYQEAPGSRLSLLAEIQLEGSGADGATESFPPVRCRYSAYEPAPRYLPVTAEDGRLPLGQPDAALVDMDGDGLPDVLQTDRAGHRYWKNLGGGRFAAARQLAGAPAGLRIGEPGVSFADLTGDGAADLFRADDRLRLVARNTGAGRWSEAPAVARQQFPLAISAASSRLVDLDGDGVPDLLQSGMHGFALVYNQADAGWSQPQFVPRQRDIARFPDVDLDDDSVYLADMSGDGLTDIVSIQSGEVAYWPYYGYGRWGARVTMENAPALPQGFRRERLFLADLDGDGTADLVYVDGDRVLYWLNQSGLSWSAAFVLPFVPPPNVGALHMVDLLGSGAHGLCWASASRGGAPARFLDLGGGAKPYLLTVVDSGFGATTTIEYTTTSAFRSDHPSGDAWGTYLPFPIQVVSALVDEDRISQQRAETRFAYERGYYDPLERVFRGFEMVEMTSVGDAHTPTVVQRTTFNLGAMLGPEERFLRTPRERAVDHALCGSAVRVEIFQQGADGGRTPVSSAAMEWAAREEFSDGQRFVHFPQLLASTAAEHAAGAPDRIDSASYAYDQFGNVTLKRRATRFADQPADDALISEQRVSFALNEDAWLVGLPARLSTRDGAGRLLNDKRLRYDGDAFEGLPGGQAERGLVRRSEELALADWALPAGYAEQIDPAWGLAHDGEGWYRLVEAYAHDACGNVVGQRDSLGRTVQIAYDADSLFPASVTDAAGGQTAAIFDARSAQPDTITAPGGNQTRYVYTPVGRLQAQFDTVADGTLQLTQFFATRHPNLADGAREPARVISVRPHQPGASIAALEAADLATLPEISVEYAYYDGRGNLLQRACRSAGGAGGWKIGGRRRYTRNDQSALEFPNLHAETPEFQPDPADAIAVRMAYGPTGQVTRVEHPDGGRFLVAYHNDRVEKWDAETGDDAAPIVERYNALGHLVGVDSPDGGGATASTSYEVDHAGRILAISDARGVSARYTYAGPGPAVRIAHAEAGERSYWRDAAGSLRRRTDGQGRELSLDYDDHGRLTSASDTSDPANPRVVRRMTYDALGLAQIDEMGVTTRLVNDRLGRAVSRTLEYPGGQTLTLERAYGMQSEARALTYPDGSRIELEYYDSGAVRGVSGVVERVEYDVHDNPLAVRFSGGVQASYRYDPAMKRLIGMELSAGAASLRQLGFEYDRNGCIAVASDTIGGATVVRRYAYDRLYRLTRASTFQTELGGPLLRDDAYSYSLTGDITASGEAALSALRYDDPAHPGRLTSVEGGGQARALGYDDAGRMLEFDTISSIRYDIWDRVEAIALRDGTRMRFAYDAGNQRVWRRIDRPDGSSDETRYVEGLYEESAAGSRASIYLGKLLVAVRTTPAGGAASLACVLTDQLGSILATCDQAGAVLTQQQYTPFGLPLLAVGEDTRYTGAPPEPACGMVQMGARWYHPLLGRFITPDWFIIENPSRGQRLPQSLNSYSYAINNPVMLRDPSGKFFGLDDLIVAAVGFVVGFVTGVIVGIAEGRSFGDTLLLGLEAGLCGAAGAWLAYITLGAATAALGAIGLGVSSGVATGLAVGAAVVGGLNGVISGALEIYDWSSPVGWLSFLADSTWGLAGTTLGVIVHGINLFYGDSRNYSFELSRRQNRHVYDGGFGFGNFAFTQGNVTSNLGGRRGDLVDHETLHIWQSRIFGPIFQVTYIAWLIVGGVVGFLIGIPLAIAGEQGLGTSIEDVAYRDNPWESWAYDVGGSGAGGKLAWT